LGVFIRSLIGLDREAAKAAFSEYLARNNMTANQIEFINRIIDYLTQNGVMEPGRLYESPFTDYNPAGLDGVFNDADADGIISILRSIQQNAAA
jgi:type I restriction enzyme R subunit